MNERDYEVLYDLPDGEYQGRLLDGVRTVTIRAGRQIEVKCHPIIAHWPQAAKREAKRRKSSKAVDRNNLRNRIERETRLIEYNFTEAAFVLTFTYDYPAEDYGLANRDALLEYYEANGLPEDDQDVRRDVRNFLAKVRRRMQQPSALKWDMHIEEGVKEQPYGLPNHLHAHMVLEAGDLTHEEIKTLWTRGRLQCDRLDLKNDGARRIAEYLAKQKRGRRWWSHSRNLKEPVPTVSDRKMSRRRLERIAEDVRVAGKEIFEKLYPGYRLCIEPRITYSDFMPGCYIYARLRRIEDPGDRPPWERAKKGRRD